MRTAVQPIRDAIDEALSLIKSGGGAAEPENSDVTFSDMSPSKMLGDIGALRPQIRPLEAEPIRTIHHFSCTGGTLFAKCIASMANVLVLNEIDLQSSLTPSARGQVHFTPTDLVALLRQGDPGVECAQITPLFLSGLQTLRAEQWKIGRHLVLRDHTHSHFLTGDGGSERPTFLETISGAFPTRSIVTVRDPVDSYLSMTKKGWHKHFSPATFDEYCRRYLIFLEKYDGVPIVKYEEFVSTPEATMQRICELLELAYFDGFEEVFSAFKFSGDSGRQSNKISFRHRLQMKSRENDLESNATYLEVIKALDYR